MDQNLDQRGGELILEPDTRLIRLFLLEEVTVVRFIYFLCTDRKKDREMRSSTANI